MVTLTNKTANTVSMTNKPLPSQSLTWNEANFTWDNGGATWDNPMGVTNKQANTTTLTNKPANV